MRFAQARSVLRWINTYTPGRFFPSAAVFCVVAVLFATTLTEPAYCATTGDLDLTGRLEQYAKKVERIKNPHEISCSECHVQLGNGRFLQYLVDDDTISLCLECHTPSHLHPVGVPASSDTDVLLQIWLPLGKGTLGDQVICLSCHYMHSDEYRPFQTPDPRPQTLFLQRACPVPCPR